MYGRLWVLFLLLYIVDGCLSILHRHADLLKRLFKHLLLALHAPYLLQMASSAEQHGMQYSVSHLQACSCRRYAGLDRLVAHNADYVVDGLCRQLRHLDEHPR